MKLRFSLLTLACLIIVGSLFAQSDVEEKKAAVHVSFFPPLSTNGMTASQYTNRFSFSILAGLSKNETGLAFASLGNVILNDARGFQFAGLFNYVGNDASGFQFGGLGNVAGNRMDGMQLAGLTNITNEVNGFQLAGLGNVASGITGFQFAGLGNVARDITGFQFGGLGNVAEDVTGFQFGGLFNVAKKVKGFQFAGLVNIADESDYSIGILNIIRKGEYGVGVAYNELGSTVVSLRSGGKVFYGILGFGYNHKTSGNEFLSEAGYGFHINCLPWLRINNEFKLSSLGIFKKETNFTTGYFLQPAFKLCNNIELFGGPSINYLYTEDVNDKMIPSNSLWKKETTSSLKQIYIGYQVGLQYIF